MKALQIAASGMAAQQMRVDVVSNNLANMSTTWPYNARRAVCGFHYQQLSWWERFRRKTDQCCRRGFSLALVSGRLVSVVLAQGSLTATGG